MRKFLSPLALVAALVAAGCATATTPTAGAPIPDVEVLSTEPLAATATSTTTTTVPASTTSTTTSTTIPVNPECSTSDSVEQGSDALDLANRIETAVAHPGFVGHDVSVSVWVDGWGEVATHNPDQRLLPASNQKLLVAIGANANLDLDATLSTKIDRVGDDLVIRAAADPTLTFPRLMAALDTALEITGPHPGRLIIDVSEFPQATEPDGWLDWHSPQFVGPLSGLMLENNRWTQADELLADPDQVNGERIASFLAERGVQVDAITVASAGEAPVGGETLSTVESAPIGSLVRTMLLASDNQHADLLLMELGRQASGTGTLDEGAKAVEEVLYDTCGSLDGLIDDGSGLSRGNLRSAGSFVASLAALHGTPEGDLLRSQLPIGGVSGTLSGRFGGPNAGRVQAKTGTILNGRSLTGWASMANGRDAIFSVIVNGEDGATSASVGAIDALVREILAT